MADNTTINPGANGDVIATDDIGGIKYPRTKIVFGADGVNDGDVSAANPFPVEIYDIGQRNIVIDTLGNLKVAQLTRLVGGMFDGTTLETEIWSKTETNGGTVTLASGLASLATNVTANGQAVLTSVRKARFMAGVVNSFVAGVRTGDTGTSNNIRRWGMFDANNGVFFELENTVIGVTHRKNAVDTRITSFNGPSPFVLDTNFHIYEIYYYPGGAAFYQDRKLIHEVTTTTTAICDTTSLKIGFENRNISGSTTNVSLHIRGTAALRFGGTEGRPNVYNTTAAETKVLKRSPGHLQKIIINKKGSASGAVTVYDNTAGSGTVLATIDTVNPVGAVLDYDLDFDTGLTLVTTATLGDITVLYN